MDIKDELLSYYNKELTFIRELGSEFAKEQAKVAGRISINDKNTEDPHVSRLIESYAYLNARIQHKLNDDFPELSDSLLSVLFPHYQRPIPSMAIIHFDTDKQLESSYTVPDNTILETEPFKGERCNFTTVYPIELLPIKVNKAKFYGLPFVTPGSSHIKGAQSLLHLSLTTFTSDITFADIKPDKIRFYLKGLAQHINPLYEFLLKDCVNVVLAESESDTSPIFLGNKCIKSVGFSEEEGLLPYPKSSFPGYRLLTEYFAFPEKFMFIDFTGLADKISEKFGNNLNLYIYMSSLDQELEKHITEKTFLLGCSPAINLFPHKTDPIKLDHTVHEYQIIPDPRRPVGYEVYSVDKVIAASSDGEKEEFHPIYGLNHEQQESLYHAYWFASRRDSRLGNFERSELGTDVFISLVDLDFNPNIPDDRVLILDTTCSNREQASKLPSNSSLQCLDSAPPCSKIYYIDKPSVPVRPPLKNSARWRLLSHLNLNHLSLTGRDDATAALKEILRLYEFKDSSVNRAIIQSIVNVDAHPISAPLTIDGRATLCRGVEIEITLDELLLSGSSGYLFASVLEYFFGLYCSINSFTRVLIKLKNKEGYLKKCPPRAGQKVLL